MHSENEFVVAWKIEFAKCFERMVSVFDIYTMGVIYRKVT